MLTRKIFLIILLLLIILPIALNGEEYYVKRFVGNDLWAGTNWDTAWESIQKAADTMVPGDIVYIAAGHYLNGGNLTARVIISNSGTAVNPITYKAYTNGVIIDAGGGLGNGIYIDDADYIVIDGLDLTGGTQNGILLDSSTHITIKNCNIYGNTWNGIQLQIGSNDVTISRNKCYGNASCGIYIWGSYRAKIFNNLLYYNGGLSNRGGVLSFNCNGPGTTIISNNIINYNSSGLALAWGNNVLIKNCTIVSNDFYGIFGDNFGSCEALHTIIAGNGDYEIHGEGGSSIDILYCDVWDNDGNYWEGIWQTNGSFHYDPQFKTGFTDDFDTSFLLKSKYTRNKTLTGDNITSPCIDNGDHLISVPLPDLRMDIGALNTTNNIGYPDNPTDLGPPEYTNGSIRTVAVATLDFTLHDAVLPSSMDFLRYRIQLSTDAAFTSLVTDYTSSFTVMSTRSYVTPSLSYGSYYWRVMAEDNKQGTYGNTNDWSYANNGNIAFTIVNDEPVLSWIGTGDFISKGVSPLIGTTGDTYEFRVMYIEPNDKPPVVRQLWIDLNDNGNYNDSGEKINMDAIDTGDVVYTDGKDYRKSLVINYAGDGVLNYKFHFNNGTKNAVGEPAEEHVVEIKGLPVNARVLDNVIHLNEGTKCRVIFVLDKKCPVQMKIYDITGRLIKEIKPDRVALRIENEIYWEGKNDSGDKVGYGTYLLYFKAGELELKEKVAVVR